MTLDENDLREGLRALTAAAPASPHLVDRSVGRAARIRRRRMTALAVATVVAVAVPATTVRLAANERRTPAAHTPTTIRDWPRHIDPALQPYLDRAISDYLRPGAFHEAEGDPVPLFAADVPGTDEVAVAFALCHEECTAAVLSFATKSSALEDTGDPGVSNWISITRDVVGGVPVAPLATYLRPSDNRPGNVLVVLGPPETAAVSWTSEPKRPDTGGSGRLDPFGGAFAGSVGYLSAPAKLSLLDAKGRLVAAGTAGTDTLLPAVPPVDAPALPAGWELAGGAGGQLENGSTSLIDSSPGGASAVFVVCDGFRPVAVVVAGVNASAPCDRQAHQIDFPPVRSGDLEVHLSGDPYTAYHFVLAKRTG
jgi:hypothetical protein